MKYCLRTTALFNSAKMVIACLGTCPRDLFGTPFLPGALPNLSPLMTSRVSKGLVNFDLLAGASSYARIASLTISVTANDNGSFTGWSWASVISARFYALLEWAEQVFPAQARRTNVLEFALSSSSSSLSTGPHCSRIPAYWSIVCASTRSAYGGW